VCVYVVYGMLKIYEEVYTVLEFLSNVEKGYQKCITKRIEEM